MINTNTWLSQGEPPVLSVAELQADPHGVFRRFRPLFPFIWRSDGMAIVLRAAHVRQLAADPRIRSPETEFARLRGIEGGLLLTLFQEGMLTSNGTTHRRRRAPFAQTFAFRIIAGLRPKIRAAAESILDEWALVGEADFLERSASPLPARMFATILGLPAEDVHVFTGLVYSVARALSSNFTTDDIPLMHEDARRLLDYVNQILAEKRGQPVGDLLSIYLDALAENNELSSSEAIVQIALLILAGSDTTRGALASTDSLLLKHGQYRDICADPALIPGAVSEGLRFEPSVGSIARVASVPIELNGRILESGQLITLSTMSAMRDEAVYGRPDDFDIRRTDQQRWYPVFGGGVHRCLGEALARAELEESLAALAARVPDRRLTAPAPVMRGHTGIRQIAPVRVAWARVAPRPPSFRPGIQPAV